MQLKHFGTTTDEEGQKILDGRVRPNTSRVTKSNLKVLSECLVEKDLKTFDEFTNAELPNLLVRFYLDLRKSDCELYKLQSLKCIRAGINRHTNETRNLDIIADPSFSQANEVFKGVSVKTKSAGKGFTKSKRPIHPDDVDTMTQY